MFCTKIRDVYSFSLIEMYVFVVLVYSHRLGLVVCWGYRMLGHYERYPWSDIIAWCNGATSIDYQGIDHCWCCVFTAFSV